MKDAMTASSSSCSSPTRLFSPLPSPRSSSSHSSLLRSRPRRPCHSSCFLALSSPFVPGFRSSILTRQSQCGHIKNTRFSTSIFASNPEQLKKAREDLKELIKQTHCNPILIRLGWHDAGTYDKNIEEWPTRGGANGSLRYDMELNHAANAGLNNAVKLITPIKEKYPDVTWADFFQLASVTAIEEAGGPKISLRYGRVQTDGPDGCCPEGKLPDAGPSSPAEHLRMIFYRMGLSDKDIVALSGAHTLGRSRPERSGFGKPVTKYTKDGPGSPGGQSWTVEWLKFDNSYFKDIKEKRDEDLLVLPTDAAIFEDPGFKVYAEKYAEDQDAFFKDYAESHAKLSELGAKFDPPEGFRLDEPKQPAKQPVPEKFVATKYSSDEDTRKELSDTMKAKIRAEYLAVGGSPDQPLKSNYFLNIIVLIGVLALLSSLIINNNNGGF